MRGQGALANRSTRPWWAWLPLLTPWLLPSGCGLDVSGLTGRGDGGTVLGRNDDASGTTPCTKGARRCFGDFVQECQADGRYESIRACAAGQCMAKTAACATTEMDGSASDAADGGADGGHADAADGSPADAAEGGANGGPADASDGGSFATASMASCEAPGEGRTDCGNGSESCCMSPLVPGGTFNRSDDPAAPATLSAFRLDKHNVTVGRFRKFVDAWVGGWRPAFGSGKHSHLNSGQGLRNATGGFEAGWSTAWSNQLPTTKDDWDSDLACHSSYPTWTSAAGSNEKRPINCVHWYDAYAFCTWDGGFLPSEAEVSFAASGGEQQRPFPWGSDEGYQYASYDCMGDGVAGCSVSDLLPVGSKPLGDGRWGHSDLVGTLWAWNLDWNGDYSTPCTDCARASAGTIRVIRGGAFYDPASLMRPSVRNANSPVNAFYYLGFRCARTP